VACAQPRLYPQSFTRKGARVDTTLEPPQFSMGGLRFGYASAWPDLAEKLHHFGVNSMATAAIQCAKTQLGDKQLIPLRKQAMADTRNRTFDWMAKNNYSFTPSQTNHFMLDVKRPGGPVINALAHQSVMIGRTWPIMPNWPRVTVGSPSDMQSFQTALLEVEKMPDGKVKALAHPYPHLVPEHSC
jgi:histidinol-phosphate aminotransferase